MQESLCVCATSSILPPTTMCATQALALCSCQMSCRHAKVGRLLLVHFCGLYISPDCILPYLPEAHLTSTLKLFLSPVR